MSFETSGVPTTTPTPPALLTPSLSVARRCNITFYISFHNAVYLTLMHFTFHVTMLCIVVLCIKKFFHCKPLKSRTLLGRLVIFELRACLVNSSQMRTNGSRIETWPKGYLSFSPTSSMALSKDLSNCPWGKRGEVFCYV